MRLFGWIFGYDEDLELMAFREEAARRQAMLEIMAAERDPNIVDAEWEDVPKQLKLPFVEE